MSFLSRLFAKRYAPPAEVEKAEYKFYIDYLRAGMTVFDVGARAGEASILFAKFVGRTGTVHAFEASSRNYEKVAKVCELTSHSQVVVNKYAVSDREGVVSLYVYDDDHSGWNSLAERPLEKYGIDLKPERIEEVDSVTVDGYCERNGIGKIDLLKIDVEGAEYQVLLGARRMLEGRRIGCCIFEFGQTTFDMGNNPGQIESYLAGLGYGIRNVVAGQPVFPGRSDVMKSAFSMHVARPE